MFWAWNVDLVLWRGAYVEGLRDVDDDVLVKNAAACGGTVPAGGDYGAFSTLV